MIASALT